VGSVGTNLYGKGVDEILERTAIGSDSNWYVYYPQQNHEGSINLLTDGGGNVIERYRYDAFGAPTVYTDTYGARTNTIYDNRFLFTGREYAATYRSTNYNPSFNFYEYRARAYNPTLGRFMSEDPKGFEAGDYNLFRYCHNDPIDHTDPMGTDYHSAAAGYVTQEVLDHIYNRAMAAAQWAGSDLMHANTAGGAIGIAAMGQQVFSGLSRAAATVPKVKSLQMAQSAKSPKDDFKTGAYIQRTETGLGPVEIYTKNGVTYYQTNINWALTVYDHGRPVPNLDLKEHLTYRDERDFIRPKEHGFYTGPDGRASDLWRMPFTSPEGHVISVQSFESRLGKTEGWTTRVDAQGGYDPGDLMQFFH
jgi:RHS repeat-associated protein